ncbi:GNAT family N-acetyltransferase [Kineosporia rhizophila]|uniref:GNAT family N-acetyltransferase n=1 Tax=Kineosporia TaxID=49184 RepID=UPI001E5ED9A7|nr:MULTISPECIES: GNAT family N-acetyltransferase [Kineosporia]MCE0539252.1 GNAT family N-acetyltransferase [Kineosporia rhizophila]GLY14477.1 hypothetical protein Kisp01_14920 [Kineosporia sp. NBRC 101677]
MTTGERQHSLYGCAATKDEPRPSLEPRILGPSDWRDLRKLRLRALKDSPHGFAHSLQQERRYRPKRWRRLLTESTWVEVRMVKTGKPVGIACLRGESPDHVGVDPSSEVRYVEGVWVDRGIRGRGSGAVRLLMEQVEKLAREQDIQKLLLWVFEENEHARDVYAALEFTPTKDWDPEGDTSPIKVGSTWRVERRMGKCLV